MWNSVKNRTLLILISIAVCAHASYYVWVDASASILNGNFREGGRIQQYLGKFGALLEPRYAEIADFLIRTKAHRISLKQDFDALEYPFWLELKQRGFNGTFEHYDEHAATEARTDYDAIIVQKKYENIAVPVRAGMKTNIFHWYIVYSYPLTH